ncbi:MAG TPA: hypothetical protein VKB77_04750 [Terriglobales bacterium]|nr:hypothetical protein [Terriglobales bacterium]
MSPSFFAWPIARAQIQVAPLSMSGTFHFEHERPKQVLVLEGTLSEDRLAALNSMLNSGQFRRLLPDAAAIDLRSSGLDELTLSVPRQDQWASLRLVSGLANDHVHSLLDQSPRGKSGVLRNPPPELSSRPDSSKATFRK